MPAAVTSASMGRALVVAVMIGVDPHKGSHTAVAMGAAGEPLDELRVGASAGQAQQLLAWEVCPARIDPGSGAWCGGGPSMRADGVPAAAWPERTWAIEGAAGLGHLLAQQLVAAGERVLDVPPRLGARVRLLAAGAVNKNDPNDARSVAVAALRSASQREVKAGDHAAVLKVWAKRHRDLGRTRTQVACRLHAVLCELIPGGVLKRITAAHAAGLLEHITRRGPWRQPGASSPPHLLRICAAPAPRCAMPRTSSQLPSGPPAPL
jgi:transposase